MAVCHYHRDRPGIGVCMRCRAVICVACCTRVDGINHCHACLQKLGRRTESSQPGSQTTVLAFTALGLTWLVLFSALWLVQGKLAP